DFSFFFEVPVADADGYGEVVYTTLSYRVMPLIRYRSSDLTRLVDGQCQCGISTGRLAKIRGRCDEMVVCGMGNVGPWVFDEVLRGVNGQGADWQAIIKHDGRRDVIELCVELAHSNHQRDVERAVLDNLRAGFADFWKNYEMKLYE